MVSGMKTRPRTPTCRQILGPRPPGRTSIGTSTFLKLLRALTTIMLGVRSRSCSVRAVAACHSTEDAQKLGIRFTPSTSPRSQRHCAPFDVACISTFGPCVEGTAGTGKSFASMTAPRPFTPLEDIPPPKFSKPSVPLVCPFPSEQLRSVSFPPLLKSIDPCCSFCVGFCAATLCAGEYVCPAEGS